MKLGRWKTFTEASMKNGVSTKIDSSLRGGYVFVVCEKTEPWCWEDIYMVALDGKT